MCDNGSENDRMQSGIERDHIYVGTVLGLRRWSTEYEEIVEWAGGEENVSIMHKRGREYVLDLSTDPEVIENQEACLNRPYDCGHVAYGPPKRLPKACPRCKQVATDGGAVNAQTDEVVDEWRDRHLGVTVKRVVREGVEDEKELFKLYAARKDRYGSLTGEETREVERQVQIAEFPPSVATEVLFGLAEAHGYDLEAR